VLGILGKYLNYVLTCLEMTRTPDITWSKLGQELAISTSTRGASSGLQSCASCPRYSSKGNLVMRTITFELNSRTQLADHAQLDCQLHGCNSLENVNRIYRASKITFDFEEFFKNSSRNTI
jgi:hypothetical protein